MDHGVFTQNVAGAGGTVVENKSSVIVVIGVSPFGPTQELVLCNNRKDDEQFGAATPDNSIAKSLDIIRNEVQASVAGSDGSCPIVVINVFENGMSASFDVDKVIGTDGTATLNFTLCGNPADVMIFIDGDAVNVAAGEDGTYVYGVDYSLDAWGNFKDITGTYIGETLQFTDGGETPALDITEVTAADIIGAYESGVRTGSYLVDLIYSQWGFKPKVFICPLYNQLLGVGTRLQTLASSNRGVYLNDMDNLVTVADVLTERGAEGRWFTQSPASVLLYPWIKSFDTFANASVDFPYAPFFAAKIVATDLNIGYWESPSNLPIYTATGVAMVISCDISDKNSEASLLNNAGIVTYRTAYGTGFMTWGNRNASHPTNTDVTKFISIYRADGMVADNMEAAAAPNVDRGITQVWVDRMKQIGNNQINTLIQRGGVLPGSYVTYRREDNSVEDLADGKVVFYRNYMIPVPGESVTFKSKLDITLYKGLK